MAVILAEEMEKSRYCIGIAASLSIIVMMVFPFNCMAADYTVGDSSQWNLGVDYSTWASSKKFAVGDNLVFTYSALHSVMEVSKAAHDSCSTDNALKSYTGGSNTIALDSPGTKYFICGTSGHCSGGMKLAVTVGAMSSTTPSAPSPPKSTTPSSTSSNAAVTASYVQIVLVGSLVVGALALLML